MLHTYYAARAAHPDEPAASMEIIHDGLASTVSFEAAPMTSAVLRDELQLQGETGSDEGLAWPMSQVREAIDQALALGDVERLGDEVASDFYGFLRHIDAIIRRAESHKATHLIMLD